MARGQEQDGKGRSQEIKVQKQENKVQEAGSSDPGVPPTPPKNQDSVVSFQVFILTVLNKCSLPNCRVQYDCGGNSKLLQLIMHYTAEGESKLSNHI